MVFGCQSIENTAKTSVLDRLYAEKRVNYGVLTENIIKTLKNTVKNNVNAQSHLLIEQSLYQLYPNQKDLRCGRPPHAKRGEYITKKIDE